MIAIRTWLQPCYNQFSCFLVKTKQKTLFCKNKRNITLLEIILFWDFASKYASFDKFPSLFSFLFCYIWQKRDPQRGDQVGEKIKQTFFALDKTLEHIQNPNLRFKKVDFLYKSGKHWLLKVLLCCDGNLQQNWVTWFIMKPHCIRFVKST